MSVGEMVIAAFGFLFSFGDKEMFSCVFMTKKKKKRCAETPQRCAISLVQRGIEAYKQEKKRGDIVFS